MKKKLTEKQVNAVVSTVIENVRVIYEDQYIHAVETLKDKHPETFKEFMNNLGIVYETLDGITEYYAEARQYIIEEINDRLALEEIKGKPSGYFS